MNGQYFLCDNNKLTSLKGCPKEIFEDFHCSDNDVKFTKDDVRALCKVKGNIYV